MAGSKLAWWLLAIFVGFVGGDTAVWESFFYDHDPEYLFGDIPTIVSKKFALDAHLPEVPRVGISADGSLFCTPCGDAGVCLWSTQSGNERLEVESVTGSEITACTITIDGRIVVGDANGSIAMLSEEGDVQKRYKPPKAFTGNPAVADLRTVMGNPDVVLAALDGGYIVAWDSQTGTERYSLKLKQARAMCVTPNLNASRILISTTASPSVLLAKVEPPKVEGARDVVKLSGLGKKGGTLTAGTGCAFEAKGRFACTTHGNNTVLIWDTAESLLFGIARADESHVLTTCAFREEDNSLLAGSTRGIVVFRIPEVSVAASQSFLGEDFFEPHHWRPFFTLGNNVSVLSHYVASQWEAAEEYLCEVEAQRAAKEAMLVIGAVDMDEVEERAGENGTDVSPEVENQEPEFESKVSRFVGEAASHDFHMFRRTPDVDQTVTGTSQIDKESVVVTASPATSLTLYAGLANQDAHLISEGINAEKLIYHGLLLDAQTETLKQLLKKAGIVPALRSPQGGLTALHVAATVGACGGEMDVPQLYERHNISTKSRDWRGRAPIHYAAMFGRLECIEVFANSGFSVNVADYQGYDALRYAILFNQPEAAELLVSFGAHGLSSDEMGRTSMSYVTGDDMKSALTRGFLKSF